MLNLNKILLLFCVIYSINPTIQELSDEARLHSYLFSCNTTNCTPYSPDIRPVKTLNTRLKIDARIGIKRLYEMDEVNHKLTLFAFLFKRWKDEYLQWKPKDFGGIEYIYVDYSRIWTPQLQITTRTVDEYSKPSDYNAHEVYDNYPVRLNFDGTVQFVPMMRLETDCVFNYAYYPFDVQYCAFIFQMPYDSQKVLLTMSTYFTSEYYKYNNIWAIDDINNMPTTDKLNYPMNVLQIKLKRATRNYMHTFPSYIVYILTLLMFLLPQTSNQRIIIGSVCLIISTLLAYMMTKNLPHNDVVAWPVLGKLYLFNTVLISFSLMFSAFIINASRDDHNKSVPDWLKKITIHFLSKIFCIQSLAYTVFNAQNFKLHDDENIAFRQNVTSQIVMSEIDPDMKIRNRPTQNNETEQLNNPFNTSEIAAMRPLDDLEENEINGEQEAGTSSSQADPTRKYNFTKLLKKIYEQMDQLKYKMQRDTYRNCINNEWMLIGTLLDKVLFFVYCGIVIFTTMTIFKQN